MKLSATSTDVRPPYDLSTPSRICSLMAAADFIRRSLESATVYTTRAGGRHLFNIVGTTVLTSVRSSFQRPSFVQPHSSRRDLTARSLSRSLTHPTAWSPSFRFYIIGIACRQVITMHTLAARNCRYLTSVRTSAARWQDAMAPASLLTDLSDVIIRSRCICVRRAVERYDHMRWNLFQCRE